MRMERINEHQVRCVVTSQDLKSHQISPADLKYGSKEMQELFREMLKNASEQYHFNEDGLPVMIEAIPFNQNELLIIISAVENAEELDPHFARFRDTEGKTEPLTDGGAFQDEEDAPDLKEVTYRFESFNEVVRFCHKFPAPKLRTELYKGETAHEYFIMVHRPDDLDRIAFIKLLNIINEFTEGTLVADGTDSVLSEHGKPVMKNPHLTLAGL